MNNIYQHFREEEQPFINRVAEWIQRVDYEYTPYLTSFLNPREQYILTTLIGQVDTVRIEYFGGTSGAERQRGLLCPNYYEVTEDDYEIVLFEINYPEKFSTLNHGQILGTIIAAGISREAIGDIITKDNRWQLFVSKTLEPFLSLEITSIGRTSVSLEHKPISQALTAIKTWKKSTEIVSSLRLDAFLASSLNLSREKSKHLIQAGKVKLNWMPVEEINKELTVQDVVSIRGFGRLKLMSQDGRTKKDKYLITVGALLRD